MAKGNHPVYVQMRVDFGSGASVGPGKVALLERISAVGSLSQAARDLGLSYRRAWLLLDDLNPETVAAAVRRLLDDPAAYQRLQANCRVAREVWNWEREQEVLLKVWKGVGS